MMKECDLYMNYFWFHLISRLCLLPIDLTFHKRNPATSTPTSAVKPDSKPIPKSNCTTTTVAIKEPGKPEVKVSWKKEKQKKKGKKLKHPGDIHGDGDSVALGQIRIQRKGWRKGIWKCWFVCGAIHGHFLAVRLAQSIMWGADGTMGHLSLHIVVCTFSLVMMLWAVLFFCKDPEVNEGIFNQLFLCDEDHKVSRLRYSMQEWLILFLPASLFFACMTLYISMYIHDWTSLQFIYSLLPPQHKTKLNCVLLGIFESSLLFYYLCVVYYGIFTQLAFIKNFGDNLDQGANHVKSRTFVRSMATLTAECARGRRMELKLKYFNLIYSNIIFSWKLYLITVSITPWYFGIRLMLDHPITSCSSFFLAVYHTTIFIVIYDRAFSVPMKMDRFKTEVLLVASQSLRMRADLEEIKRRIRSIPNIGIKVGSFHTLERTSTPIFVDFITKQVCSLLLTFR